MRLLHIGTKHRLKLLHEVAMQRTREYFKNRQKIMIRVMHLKFIVGIVDSENLSSLKRGSKIFNSCHMCFV